MDAESRDRERRASLDGDHAARARLLVTRVRSGALAPLRLELAAHLGDEGARLAAGQERPPVLDTVDWVRALEAWGMEPLARASIAASLLLLPRWRLVRPQDERPARAIQATIAWVRCPCRRCQEVAASAGELADLAWSQAADELDARSVCQAARYCTYSARPSRPPRPEECGPEGSFTTDGDDAAECVALVIDGLTGTSTELDAARTVRAAVRDALAPWALGEADPLERHAGP